MTGETKWVLVPAEPTPEMLLAATENNRDRLPDMYTAIYRAMLAAAPKPPVEPVAWQMRSNFCGTGWSQWFGITVQEFERRTQEVAEGNRRLEVRYLYATPPATATLVAPEYANDPDVIKLYLAPPDAEAIRKQARREAFDEAVLEIETRRARGWISADDYPGALDAIYIIRSLSEKEG